MSQSSHAALRPVIIYVEDNQGDAILLQEALQERAPEVSLVVIEDGAKALHYFQIKARVRDIPPPHCILLDTHLPIVTGLQLLAFIRTAESYNDTPVYIFADEADYRVVSDVVRVSKESFLIKPAAWPGYLDLAELLMKSSVAKAEGTPASPTDNRPEVHPEGPLRLDP
jgi:CheY-like chemotaxis protein